MTYLYELGIEIVKLVKTPLNRLAINLGSEFVVFSNDFNGRK